MVAWRGDQPAKWVTRREPEWTDEQEAWMHALAFWREGLCPLCGGPREECLSIDADDAYVAEAQRCSITDARLLKAEQGAAANIPRLGAVLYSVKRRRR